MNNSTGINREEAVKSVNLLKKSIASFDNDLKKIASDILTMQKDAWYGGNSLDKWYRAMKENYENNVRFISSLEEFTSEFERYLKSTCIIDKE